MLNTIYFVLTWFSIGLTFAFGFCFLFQKIPPIPALDNYKKARIAMAVAYISLSVLNTVEILSRSETHDIEFTRSISIVMGAFQALLYTCTFVTLINLQLVTRKKIFLEMGGITVLSVLLFASLFGNEERLYFNTIFYVFVGYYIIMLLRYTFVFLQKYRHYSYQVDNFFPEKEIVRFRWIYYSFFAALTVGVCALLLTFSENTLHYILFTVLFIGFYVFFGIKFINYVSFFEYIGIIIEEKNELPDKEFVRLPYSGLKIIIDQWVEEKKYIQQGINIEQLSQEFNTNRTYISNYINSHYQQTFSDWINNLRIEEAKNILLEEPELSITNVSEKIGYADKSNFNRQFAKRVGITPGAWRKMQILNN